MQCRAGQWIEADGAEEDVDKRLLSSCYRLIKKEKKKKGRRPAELNQTFNQRQTHARNRKKEDRSELILVSFLSQSHTYWRNVVIWNAIDWLTDRLNTDNLSPDVVWHLWQCCDGGGNGIIVFAGSTLCSLITHCCTRRPTIEKLQPAPANRDRQLPHGTNKCHQLSKKKNFDWLLQGFAVDKKKEERKEGMNQWRWRRCFCCCCCWGGGGSGGADPTSLEIQWSRNIHYREQLATSERTMQPTHAQTIFFSFLPSSLEDDDDDYKRISRRRRRRKKKRWSAVRLLQVPGSTWFSASSLCSALLCVVHSTTTAAAAQRRRRAKSHYSIDPTTIESTHTPTHTHPDSNSRFIIIVVINQSTFC